MALWGAGDDGLPARRQERGSEQKDLIDGPGAPRDDEVEDTPRGLRIHPFRSDLDILKAELADGRTEKRDAPLTGFRQGDPKPRAYDLQGNPRHAGTRAQIQHSCRSLGDQRRKEQAIKEDVLDDPPGVIRSNETLGFLPFNQYIQIFNKC